jgi:hypothetical protein
MRHPIQFPTIYGLPHGILHVFNTILYENEFQNPQIFQQTISLFHEQSTLVLITVVLIWPVYLELRPIVEAK